jgi:anti-anti-sigma factor
VIDPFSFTAAAEFGDGHAEVLIRGDVDITATAALEEMLALALGKRPHRLTLDLSAVGFLGCAGARVIASAAQALPPGRFTVRAPSLPAARTLQLMDLAFLIEGARPD